MPNRFDYVEWDSISAGACERLKRAAEALEIAIDVELETSREKSSAITKLEECFMWIGKAIRADQLARK